MKVSPGWPMIEDKASLSTVFCSGDRFPDNFLCVIWEAENPACCLYLKGPYCPAEVSQAPRTVNGQVNGALINPVFFKMSLIIAGWLDMVAFKGSSQPKLFYVSAVPWVRETKRPRHFDENVQELSMEKQKHKTGCQLVFVRWRSLLTLSSCCVPGEFPCTGRDLSG